MIVSQQPAYGQDGFAMHEGDAGVGMPEIVRPDIVGMPEIVRPDIAQTGFVKLTGFTPKSR